VIDAAGSICWRWNSSRLGMTRWTRAARTSASAVIVRARIKCVPGQQWGVGRAYNEIVKRIFDERGIEIPFPHQTIYFGEDRQGNAPPLRIAGRAGDGGGIDSGIDGSSAPSPA